jgi:hypothetical protein
MGVGRLALLMVVAILAGLILVQNAHSGSDEAVGSRNPGLTCSPAPCVLPPTQASEGGSIVTDSRIATDPANAKHLLLGSVDGNCPPPSALGFHLSTDGGSTWNRVDCMLSIVTKARVYWPADEPQVGYD